MIYELEFKIASPVWAPIIKINTKPEDIKNVGFKFDNHFLIRFLYKNYLYQSELRNRFHFINLEPISDEIEIDPLFYIEKVQLLCSHKDYIIMKLKSCA